VWIDAVDGVEQLDRLDTSEKPEGNEDRCTILRQVRVLDFSRVLSGPFCTRILADLGAEVIKVETGAGDPTRLSPPFKGRFASYFTQFNVGKKSIGVNLRNPKGLQLIKKLVQISHVVIENFRPGILAKMGLGYPVLKEINPRIILCSISGFGQTGAEANRLAFTDIVQAYSGLDDMSAKMMGPTADPPGFPASFGDNYASLNAAIAILAALYQCDHTGEGQAIDISMLDCLVAANDSTLQKYIFSDGELDRADTAFRPPLRMKDGYMAVALLYHFDRVIQAIGRPELLQEERFKTIGIRRKKDNFEIYLKIVREWARNTTLAEAASLFDQYDVAYSKVNSVAEVVNSQVMGDRNMFVETNLPKYGPVRVVNTPFKFSQGPCGPQGPPPDLGEHTREVCHQLLNLSTQEVEGLIQEGVLFSRENS